MRKVSLLLVMLLCVVGAKAAVHVEADPNDANAFIVYADNINDYGGWNASNDERAVASGKTVLKITGPCDANAIGKIKNLNGSITTADYSGATFPNNDQTFADMGSLKTVILAPATSYVTNMFQNVNSITNIQYQGIVATGSGNSFSFTKSGNETNDTFFKNLLEANGKTVTVSEPAAPTSWDETTGTLTIGPGDDTTAKLREFVQAYGKDNIKKVVFPDGTVWENGKLTGGGNSFGTYRSRLNNVGLSVTAYENKVGKYVSVVKEVGEDEVVVVTNPADNSSVSGWPDITLAEQQTLRGNAWNLKIVGNTTNNALTALKGTCRNVENLDLSEAILSSTQQLPSEWKSTVTTLTLPNDPNYTAVPEQFFNNATKLTTLNVPGNILTIGKEAFQGCTKLADVDWADDCSVQELGEGCFERCAFVNLEIPASVQYIRSKAFKGMSSLLTVTWPANSQCKLVENYVFTESDNITDVYVLCHIREAEKDANGNYYKDANNKDITYYPYCTNYAFDFNTTVSQTVVGSQTGATLHLPDQESRDDFDFYVGNWKSGIIFTQDMLDALKSLKVTWAGETYNVLNGWQEFVRLSGEREIVVFDFLYKTYSDNQAHPLPTGILAFRATKCDYNKADQSSTITLTKLPGIPANTGVILISTTQFVTYNNQKPGQFYLGNYSNVADEPTPYPWSATGDINYLEPTIDTGLDVEPATYDDNAKVIDRYFGLTRKKIEGREESSKVNSWQYYFSRMKECHVKENLAILRLPSNVWGGFYKDGKEIDGSEPLMFEGADGGPGVNPNEPGIDPTAYANAKISIIFEGLDEEEEESVATVIRLITSKGIDDQTTVSEDGRVYDNAYYNMQGVKVNMPTEKGIYVHNGKKVIIK